MQYSNQDFMQVKFIIAALALLMILSLGTVSGFSSEQDDRVESIKKLTRAVAPPDIWWVAPLNATWTDFTFLKILNPEQGEILSLLEKSEFSESAGDYFLIDAPFDYCDRKGQGFLVLMGHENSGLIGFRFRATATNKESLEFVTITKFEPENKKLVYSDNVGFAGILLNGDFRTALLKHRSEKAGQNVLDN